MELKTLKYLYYTHDPFLFCRNYYKEVILIPDSNCEKISLSECLKYEFYIYFGHNEILLDLKFSFRIC